MTIIYPQFSQDILALARNFFSGWIYFKEENCGCTQFKQFSDVGFPKNIQNTTTTG
jgi:hypothetical protein